MQRVQKRGPATNVHSRRRRRSREGLHNPRGRSWRARKAP